MARFDVLQELIWGNASPDERLRSARVMFRGAVVVLFAWAFGVLAPLGIVGFAKSDEVDEKVAEAMEPVHAQLGAITSQLAEQDETLKQIRVDQLAQKLRELKLTCCIAAANHEARDRMEQEIARAQRAYRALTGERYPLPPCEDGK